METEAGIQLTDKEIKLVKSLDRLAKRWKKDTNRLWLWSASGTLCVMMKGDIKSNHISEKADFGGVNPDNTVTSIDIPNDGGDW